MSEHTKEPWGISSKYTHIIKKFDFMGESNLIIASASGGPNSGPYFPSDAEANARRIVACVNACADMSTEYLEQCGKMRRNEAGESIAALIQQRDELAAALTKMNRAYVNLMENGRDRIVMLGGDCDSVDVMERDDPNLRDSRAALAKVGAGKGETE